MRFARLLLARREWKKGDMRVVSEVDCYINSDHIRLIEAEVFGDSDDQRWTRVKMVDDDWFYVRGEPADVAARLNGDGAV